MTNAIISNEKKKELNKTYLAITVSPYEAEVVKILRRFTHGKLTIFMANGFPTRYVTEVSEFFLTETNSKDILEQIKK